MANDSGPIGFFAAEMLAQTAARNPEKTAIIAKDATLSFGELNDRVGALAANMQREGVGPGDRVGLFLPNSTAIPLGYYASQKIGAVTVILDARLRGKELEGVLEDADLKLLMVHAEIESELEEAFKTIRPVPLWVSGKGGERSLESRFIPSGRTAAAPPPGRRR